MPIHPVLSSALIAAATCMVAIWILHPLAPRLGLIDQPGGRRKIHHHAIPPIGGFCIFAGLLAAVVMHGLPSPQAGIGLLGAALLVVIGGLDDRFDLGYRVRFLAQIAAALILVLGAGMQLHSLGNILGYGPVGLGPFSIPLSVFAIVGIINAFNLIDGIDGLAGGLALVALVSLLIVDGPSAPACTFLLPVLSVALLPYLACNLGLKGLRDKKIFLGDAGSMLIGYMIVWALIDATQANGPQSLPPVVALWLVALPLMDTFNVMGRRMLKWRSPFKADRGHLHHLLIRGSGSPRIALVIMLIMATVFAATALIVNRFGLAEPALFYLALLTFAIYVSIQARVPRLYAALHRLRRGRRLAEALLSG
ncbi:undecaprenyl-phosphate alpha-N-acetylglucosaminyl 1-phosphate transferase [Halochromatium sp.]